MNDTSKSPSPLKAGLRRQLYVVLWGLILYAPAVMIEFISVKYFLTPEIRWLQWGSAAALGLTFPLWIYLLAVKIRPLWAGYAKRWIYFVLSPLAHLIIVLAAWGLLVTFNFKIFEPQYLGLSQVSPDGHKVAYLYNHGLFCGFRVYVRPEMSASLKPAYSVERNCENLGSPRISWSADSSSVMLIDDRGEEFPNNAKPLDLYLGPH